MTLRPPTTRAVAATGSLVLATALALASPAAARPGGHDHGGDDHGGDGESPALTVVATGLDNPRQLSVDDGALYVAEAGRGGTQACRPGPEGPEVCFGATGAVTRVDRWGQRRVLTGLPSFADRDGTGAAGPSDVAVHDDWWAVLVGLGADPAVRASLPAPGQQLGTLLTGRLAEGPGHRARPRRHGHHGHHGHPSPMPPAPRVLADIAGYESTANPGGGALDSNPVGLWAGHRGFVVADAGGNDVVAVDARGTISTVAVFPDRLVPAPPPLPAGDVPLQAVPTSAVVGPDGALYVSQLTGFPFPVGAANVYRVVPGHAPTVYATGLTNVTDLAWIDGRLLAVQIADQGLLAAGTAPPSGSVVEVVPGHAPTTVVDDLVAPYGITAADDGDDVFVTTCSVCPGGGQVARVSLEE